MNEKKTIFKKVKENKWKILTGVCFTSTAVLGTMYGLEVKKNKQADNTANLVKRVVGGPLIDRLIKNEELKLSRVNNKIANLINKGIDEKTKKVLELKKEDRKVILETIADFKDVKDVLK